MFVEQAAENGPQPHHLEVRSADDASAHHARFAESDHGEAHGREVAKFADGFHACLQILDFRHGEGRVLDTQAARTLANVDQPILAPVDERLQEDSANQSEDGGVRADPERQGQNHGDRQPGGSHQRPHRYF